MPFPTPGLDLLSSLGGMQRPPSPDEEAQAANAAVEQMLQQAHEKTLGAQQMQQGAMADMQGAEEAPADTVSPLTAGMGMGLSRIATTLAGPGGPDYSAQTQQSIGDKNKQMRTDRADNVARLRKTYEQAAKVASETGDHEAEIKARVAINKLDDTQKKQSAADKVASDKDEATAKVEVDKIAQTTKFDREKEMAKIQHGYKLDEMAKKAAEDSKGKVSPSDALKYINTLTDNVRQDPELKDYAVIRDQLTTGRDAYRAKNSAGDIILMRAVARATDPRTGVREEEYRTFEGAQGALAARGVAMTKGMLGHGKLTEFGRKTLLNRMETIHRRKGFQSKRSLARFRLQAKEYGINPDVALQAYEPEEESGVQPPTEPMSTSTNGKGSTVVLYKGGVPHNIPASGREDAIKNYGYTEQP